MTTGPQLWFFALGLSIGLHGAGFAALSFCAHGPEAWQPRIMLPSGQAAGIPVMLISSAQPDSDDLPRLDESQDHELRKAGPPEPAVTARTPEDMLPRRDKHAAVAASPALVLTPDDEPLIEAAFLPVTTATTAVSEPESTGSTQSLADGRPFPGGAPGVLVGPTPASTNQPPAYPAEARRKRQAGTVLLHVVIEPEGDVSGASVVRSSGFKLLDQAALDAARGWRFIPANENGAAVRCEADLPVEFLLRAR